MGGWEDGSVGGWEDGRVGGWEDGGMGEWVGDCWFDHGAAFLSSFRSRSSLKGRIPRDSERRGKIPRDSERRGKVAPTLPSLPHSHPSTLPDLLILKAPPKFKVVVLSFAKRPFEGNFQNDISAIQT